MTLLSVILCAVELCAVLYCAKSNCTQYNTAQSWEIEMSEILGLANRIRTLVRYWEASRAVFRL